MGYFGVGFRWCEKSSDDDSSGAVAPSVSQCAMGAVIDGSRSAFNRTMSAASLKKYESR